VYSFFPQGRHEYDWFFTLSWDWCRLEVSSKVLGGKGIMKFVIRRAVAGVVITPLVAGLWFALVVDFILLGGVPNATPTEVWNTGLGMGVIVSLWFALGAVWKLVRK
jgi:hypothetical protein